MTEKLQIPIQVPVLARVEGEGALELRVRNGEIEDLQLRMNRVGEAVHATFFAMKPIDADEDARRSILPPSDRLS